MCVSNTSPGRLSPSNNPSVQKGLPPREQGSLRSAVTGFKVEDFLPNNLPTTEARAYSTHSSILMLILILYSGPESRRERKTLLSA